MHNVASREPKYVLLAARLRERIATGELQPHDRVPSIPQLREELGISQNTVEKAHAILEQEGLIVRRQGHGTFVAEARRRPQTGVIGFYGVPPQFKSLSYYEHLLRGIQKAAAATNLEVLLLNPDMPAVSWEKVDGVLLVEPVVTKVKRHIPPGTTCVSLLYSCDGISNVLYDDYDGMRKATEYLLAQGHRDIVYLCENDPLTGARQRGFRDALRAAGVEPDARHIRNLIPHHEDEFRGRGVESMRQWLQEAGGVPPCTALLCQNDRTAIGVLDALDEAGIRVPAGISVMGFDSTDECQLVRPRLSSVQVPLEEIGSLGVGMLFRQLKASSQAAEIVTLPGRLDLRQSVCPGPFAD